MKKVMLFAMLFIIAPKLRAQESSFADFVKATLLERVSAVSQFDFKGSERIALMDSILLIGKYNDRSIIHIQGGVNKETNPDQSPSNTTDFVWGAQFRLDPFLNGDMDFPAGWEFLRALEHGPAIHYDTRVKAWYGYYQVGLAFGLQPAK